MYRLINDDGDKYATKPEEWRLNLELKKLWKASLLKAGKKRVRIRAEEWYCFLSRPLKNGTGWILGQELFRQKAWEPMLKRLGIRYRPPYQMRQTCATLAISASENINWVARMLGHKSPG